MGGEPTNLVVIGATAGIGRWLVDHLLLERSWEQVVLIDPVQAPAGTFPSGPVLACRPPEPGDELPVAIDRPGTTALLAVPLEAVPGVLDWLTPLLAPDAVIGVVTGTQVAGIGALAARWPSPQVYGLHPLFDSSARTAEGQTFLLVGEHGPPDVPWLGALIASAGAIADSGSSTDHDAIMRFVQTTTHQALVTFADTVTSSGLDLQKLWEARTPVFEGLFGLAARVLAEHQQATIAGIQTSMDGGAAVERLADSVERWRQVVDGPPAGIEAALADIRDRFSGTLFDTIQATAATAVSAAQSKRAELARHRRLGSLVGVRPIGRPEALRVGHITEVTPLSVTLREVMVGKLGNATLLEGPGHRNAGRLGMNGTPSPTAFSLGHIDVVVGDELDAALDEWLAFIKRDVRFLVPESVAGHGVLTIVASHPGIRDATVLSEVVRTGQRAVAIRVHIRADHDVDDMAEELRSKVQATYRWPAGLSLPNEATVVHYLGPAGTFSEVAADQAQVHSGQTWVALNPLNDFDAVLSAISPGQIGVLPISSSASGLVARGVDALLRFDGPLQFGGVVDVAVRIDALVNRGTQLADLRGAPVLSHPQALGQCQAFIRRYDLVPTPCSSTAEAVRRISGGEHGVALAGAILDQPSELKVAEREVDDLSGSITRFLILGHPETFGEMNRDSAPTLRSLWVAESIELVLAHMAPGVQAFDELLSDETGRCLWVTSRGGGVGEVGDTPGMRYLGRAPWSPRTPIVRVEVDVPRG